MVVAGRHAASKSAPRASRPPRKRNGFRRIVVWVMTISVLVAVVLIAQPLFAAFWVSRDAAALESQVAQAQAQFAEGRFGDAATSVGALAQTSAELRDRTADATWWRAQHLPFIGPSFDAVHVLSAATADVAAAAQPIVDRLHGISGSGAGLAALSGSADDLRQLQHVLGGAAAQVQRLPNAGLLLGTDRVVNKAKKGLPQLLDATAQATAFVELLPGITGGDQPKKWLVMLQNPAESRGTGGLFSAFAIVEFADGAPRIVEAASRKSSLDSGSIPYADVVDPPTQALWGSDLGDWASFNLSSDFPSVARLAAAGMALRGTPIDGVVAIDPSAVSALLAGTGPVEHRGVTIDADSAQQFFTRDIYTKYPDFPDVAAKDELVMGLLYATADSLLKRPLAVKDLWSATQAAVDGGHIKAWSSDPDIEKWLQGNPTGGQVAPSAGPDAVININNVTGGKVDAYVTGAVDYQIRQCLVAGTTGTAQSTVAVALTNAAPEDLPPYVDLRLDDPSRPEGSTKVFVHVYGPRGSTATSALLDGNPVFVSTGLEAGRPVWGAPIELVRGQTHTLSLSLHEPVVKGAVPSVHAAPVAGGITSTARDSASSQPCPTVP